MFRDCYNVLDKETYVLIFFRYWSFHLICLQYTHIMYIFKLEFREFPELEFEIINWLTSYFFSRISRITTKIPIMKIRSAATFYLNIRWGSKLNPVLYRPLHNDAKSRWNILSTTRKIRIYADLYDSLVAN